jgi:hypothetical protein
MNDADKPKFAAALTELTALKPGAKLTTLQFESWWNAMRGRWTIKEFLAACERLVFECEFMPNPYHFEQLRKAGQTTPGEAFAKAMEVARDCRPHDRLSSGDPRIDAAARACGGYFAMGQYETEKLGFLERTFTEHFESISEAEDKRQALPNLTGGSKLLDAPTRGPRLIGALR